MVGKLNDDGSFTLMEIVIVLVMVGLLSGILTPVLVKDVQNAKLRRATDDAKMIGNAIGDFYKDLGKWPIWLDGRPWIPDSENTKMNFLGTFRNGQTLPADPNVYLKEGWHSSNLEEQLVTNIIQSYPQIMRSYPTSGENAWRGPYIEQLRKDPWGVDYLVDVNGLWPENEVGTTTAFVVSTGPNRTLETPFGVQSLLLSPGGDDIIFRLK